MVHGHSRPVGAACNDVATVSQPPPFLHPSLTLSVRYPLSCLWCEHYKFLEEELVLNCPQIHALVAQGSTILAEHQAGKRDFSQGRFHVVGGFRSLAQLLARRASHTDDSFQDPAK